MASIYQTARSVPFFDARMGASRLARGMSLHASGALLLYVAIQTWGVVSFNAMPGGQILPFAALALLIGGALPYFRRVERRWQSLGSTALPSRALLSHYRRERARLWTLALVAPVTWLAVLVSLGLLIGA